VRDQFNWRGCRRRDRRVVPAAAISTSSTRFIGFGLAGIAGAIRYAKPSASTVANALPLVLGNGKAVASSPLAVKGLLQLAGFFLKIGATLFGSGYVLVSYLQTGLVDQYQWLTPRQLVDAISVGQFTPGPLLTTATFIGYLRGFDLYHNTAGAVCGAVVATVSIFLPSFVLVAVVGPLLPRIRRNPLARGAFDGMNAAVVALIAGGRRSAGRQNTLAAHRSESRNRGDRVHHSASLECERDLAHPRRRGGRIAGFRGRASRALRTAVFSASLPAESAETEFH